MLDELHGTEHNACQFTDVSQLSKTGGHCSYHERHCPLPACDIIVAGFSCKDLSKANPNRKVLSASQVLGATSSPGRTADTLNGTLTVVDGVMPDVIVLENVDLDQDAEHSLGLDKILHELGRRGYDTHAFVMNCACYGLPQHRVRLFIIGVLRPGRRFKMENFIGFWSRYENMLQKCKMVGPGLVEAVLPSSSEILMKELAVRASGSSKTWDSSTIKTHRKEWLRFGIVWSSPAAMPHPDDSSSQWFASLPARAKDVLAFTYRTWKITDCELIGVDISQSIGRAPTASVKDVGDTQRTVAPTILPNTVLWLLPLHRPVIGCESLALQVCSAWMMFWTVLIKAPANDISYRTAPSFPFDHLSVWSLEGPDGADRGFGHKP